MGYKKLKVDLPLAPNDPLPPGRLYLPKILQQRFPKNTASGGPSVQICELVCVWGAFHLQTTTVGKEGDMVESKGPIFEKEGEH